jgi:hypothetical protein
MPHALIVLILFVLWLLLPTRRRAPGESRRTSKLTILFRLVLIPFAVVGFWGTMFSIADVGLGLSFVLGGVGAVLLGIGCGSRQGGRRERPIPSGVAQEVCSAARSVWRERHAGRVARREQAIAQAASASRTGTRNPKKGNGVFCEGVAVKYAWITQHRGSFPVAVMCDVLNVSPSGYHDSIDRPPSAWAERHERIQ